MVQTQDFASLRATVETLCSTDSHHYFTHPAGQHNRTVRPRQSFCLANSLSPLPLSGRQFHAGGHRRDRSAPQPSCPPMHPAPRVLVSIAFSPKRLLYRQRVALGKTSPYPLCRACPIGADLPRNWILTARSCGMGPVWSGLKMTVVPMISSIVENCAVRNCLDLAGVIGYTGRGLGRNVRRYDPDTHGAPSTVAEPGVVWYGFWQVCHGLAVVFSGLGSGGTDAEIATIQGSRHARVGHDVHGGC